MTITDPLSFWGNAIAFVALAGKTLYDLVINPKKFQHEYDAAKEQDQRLLAAQKKRDRADLSTAITFLILAVSAVLMMLALIKFN